MSSTNPKKKQKFRIFCVPEEAAKVTAPVVDAVKHNTVSADTKEMILSGMEHKVEAAKLKQKQENYKAE